MVMEASDAATKKIKNLSENGENPHHLVRILEAKRLRLLVVSEQFRVTCP
jgi:hypothetical protein